MPSCPNCSQPRSPGAALCGNCGHAFEDANQPVAANGGVIVLLLVAGLFAGLFAGSLLGVAATSLAQISEKPLVLLGAYLTADALAVLALVLIVRKRALSPQLRALVVGFAIAMLGVLSICTAIGFSTVFYSHA